MCHHRNVLQRTYIISPEKTRQGKGTRELVALYEQEQLGYMWPLNTMDSSLGESLQVRVSREAS